MSLQLPPLLPPPSPTEPFLSPPLQTMAAVMLLALRALGIILVSLVVVVDLDASTYVGASICEYISQCVKQLSQDVAQLLQEMEQSSQELSGVASGAVLFTASEQWHSWDFAGALDLP